MTLNLIEAVRDPDGTAWRAVRLTASVAFTLALVAWAALWVLRWRRGRSR
ncbi:hypothetical protein [Streptomyces sp. NPDC004135]